MQLSRTRIVAGVAAATLSLALLAGCGEDEPRPKFEDPTSASPSKSASPEEPVEPTPPAAMEGDDVAGAKAFVEYYFAVAAYAQNTGDVSSLRELGLPGCTACRGGVEAIERIYRAGGSISGAAYELEATTASPSQGSSRVSIWDLTAEVNATPQTVKKSAQASAEVDKSSTFELHLVAVHQRAKWRMAEWESTS